MRIMRELNRLTKDDSGDENQIKDRLKALQDLDARAGGGDPQGIEGIDAIDQVLDVRQQAKFRLFEAADGIRRSSRSSSAPSSSNRQQKRNPVTPIAVGHPA